MLPDCNAPTAVQITIRWPLKSSEHPHPRLTTMELAHLHDVDKAAVDVKNVMKAPLTSPVKADVAKLTGGVELRLLVIPVYTFFV